MIIILALIKVHESTVTFGYISEVHFSILKGSFLHLLFYYSLNFILIDIREIIETSIT